MTVSHWADLIVAAASFATILIGGVYFTFSTFAMRAFAEAGEAGMLAMVQINRTILRSAFMPLFFGSTALAVGTIPIGLWQDHDLAGWLMIAGGILHVGGMFGTTVAFNVPLNNRLERTPEAVWSDYVRKWTMWNHVRTITCLLAGVLFLLAIMN